MRILCVDDEPYILSTLQRFFRKDDFVVMLAGSAEKAMTLLEESGPADIVLSDYRMPGENGVELLRRIHQLWPGTVGILLSGYADIGVVTEAVEEEFIYCHLAKPWSRSELRRTIEEALQHGR